MATAYKLQPVAGATGSVQGTATGANQKLSWMGALKGNIATESLNDFVADALTESGAQTITNKTLDNTNTVTIKDANFTLQDDGDTSKQLKFQLSGITASTTRTLTVPDASTTLVGTDTTQTLTSKTLTSPRINTILDTNGATILDYSAASSAANYFRMANKANGAFPAIEMLGSSDSNIGMSIVPKGTGYVEIYKASGSGAARIHAGGADTNVSLNLTTKGSGTVQAGGVDVVTTTGTQTLTNKTLDNSNTVSFRNDRFALQDPTDTTKQIRFQVHASHPTGTTRTFTLPSGDSTLIGNSNSTTLQNKTLDNTNVATLLDTNFTLQDDGDNTKQAKFQLSGITSGQTRTFTLPDSSGTILTTSSATFNDSTFTIQDNADSSKQLKFEVSGVTTGTTSTLTVPGASTTLVGTTTTQTVTNKWIQARITAPSVSGTYTVDVTACDEYDIISQNANITNLTTTGSAVNGQRLMIRIKDNGSARTIAWDSAVFASSGVATLLTTTVASKTHYVGFVYDSATAKFICIAADPTGY